MTTLAKQMGLLFVTGALALGGYYGWHALTPAKSEERGSGAGGKARTVTVETAPATLRDLNVVVEAVGSTRARRTVEITPLASGRVTAVGFTAGKAVKEGAVLLRLDDDIQRADLAEAEARLTDAISKLQRSETLKKQNAVAAATVDSLVAQVAIARAERERAAKRLKDRVVTAPFSGVVGFSGVELGARVEEGDVVTVLDDLSAVEVDFSLPEGLFGKVAIGQRVSADAAPYPERVFSGAIDLIDSRVDPVSRSFRARAVIANDDRALPAGMFVRVSVVLKAEVALSVPEEAVVVDGSRALVFAVATRDGQTRAERRFITLGRRSFGYVEVTDGISEGEHVIVRGVQKVRDGSLVKANKPRSALDAQRKAINS